MMKFGRLAMRVEGDWWVAYYAKPDTMDGALRLGSVHMALARIPEVKQSTLDHFKLVTDHLVKAATGFDLEWPAAPQQAPEHEKSGNA